MSLRVPKSNSKNQKRSLSPYLIDLNIKLEQEVDSLLFYNKLSSSYPKLYKHVEFLCRERQQSKLASMLYQKIDDLQDAEIAKLNDTMVDGTFLELVERFVNLFIEMEEKSKSLATIFLYLDRTYLLNHTCKRTIQNYSLCGIYVKIFESKESLLSKTLMNAFIYSLNEYRKSNVELLPLVSSLIDKLFLVFNRNIKELESFIIQSTQEFYTQLHAELLQSELVSFFGHSYDIILREFRLWNQTQASTQFLKIIKFTTISNLLFLNFEKDGPVYIKPLFTSKRFQELSNLFKFIQGAKTEEVLKLFLSIWSEYIIDFITSLSNNESDNVVERLIKAKKNLHRLVVQFFQSDSTVNYKLIDAFQSAIDASQREGKAINIRLLKYIDSYFKTSDTADDGVIDDIFLIFKSIRSKEEFILSYQKDLSKRLINSSSKDINSEKKLVSLLKREVDSDEVRALPTMIDDVLNNETFLDVFHSSYSDKSYEFRPLVLNSQAWPKPRASIKFPKDLASKLTEFQSLYMNLNKKKILQWCPSLGSMSIITSFFKCGKKEFQVNTFQGLVLLQFNDHDEISFQQLSTLLQLDTRNLTSVLHSLTQGRYKVLLKVNKSTGTYYRVNEDFNEHRKVIKIKQVQMKLKSGDVIEDDGSEAVTPRIEEALTSFIIRVMKDLKTIKHDALVARVIDKFIVEKSEIKSRIDDLIKMEYITRDGLESYRYIP